MKEREQLIKELNRYFPECEAVIRCDRNIIWFGCEYVAGSATACDCGEEEYGLSAYLNDSGWFIELYDDCTASAAPIEFTHLN